MHGADQRLHPVAADQPVHVLHRVGGVALVVEPDDLHRPAAHAPAALLEVQLEGGGDVLAQRREGAGKGQHQPDAQRRPLGDGRARQGNRRGDSRGRAAEQDAAGGRDRGMFGHSWSPASVGPRRGCARAGRSCSYECGPVRPPSAKGVAARHMHFIATGLGMGNRAGVEHPRRAPLEAPRACPSGRQRRMAIESPRACWRGRQAGRF